MWNKCIVIIILICTGCCNTLKAQIKPLCEEALANPSSGYKYLLAIPSSEIDKLKGIKLNQFEAGYWMQFCIDSVPYAQSFKNLPEAKNLFELKVERTSFIIERLMQNGWTVKLLVNKDLHGFKVYDNALKERKDCEVYLGKKKLRYDDKLGMYVFKKTKKGSLLTIENQGFVQEFRLFESRPRPLGRINFRGWFNRKPGKPEFSGYLAFNQPRFRPGDTIRVKAFVVDKKGKAMNKPLTIQLRCYSASRGTFYVPYRANANPAAPGNFLWEIPVTDTFEIDRQYYVELQHHVDSKQGWYNIGVSSQLYIEDYELDQTKYSLEALIPNHVYQYGESISLLATATDANGLPVLDGTIELTVMAYPNKLYIEQLFIPDTLWSYRGALDPTGQTIITIPDSLIPEGAGYLSAHAAFINSNNELHENFTQISFDRFSGKWELKASTDEITVYFTRFGKMAKGNLTAEAYTTDHRLISRTISQDTLKIPYHPLASSYEFSHPEALQTYMYNPTATSGVYLYGNRRNDSVFLSIQNPRNLEWVLTLHKDKKIIEKKLIKDSVWNFILTPAGKEDYYAEITGIWRGVSENQEVSLLYFEKALNVTIESPSEVSPGEKTEFAIKVSDVSGKPVEGVNLTSAGVNTQFAQDRRYPEVPYFSNPAVNPPPTKQLRIERVSYTRKLNLRRQDLDRFGLTDHPYYDLHFPDMARVYLTTKTKNLPNQISLSVHEKDQRLKILYVELYGNIKQNGLITDSEQSFRTYSGYQNLVIRTHRKRIELDSIYVTEGQPCLLSVNLDIEDDQRRIIRTKRKFNRKERNSLSGGVLRIKITDYYDSDWFLFTSEDIIPIEGWDGWVQKLGPFEEGRELKLYHPATDKLISFSFNPDVDYSIMQDQLIQFNSPYEWTRKMKKTKNWNRSTGDDYCVLLENETELSSPSSTDAVFISEMPFSGAAKVAFLNNETDQFNKMILRPKEGGLIWPYSGYYNFQLEPGNYSVLMVNDSFRYFESPALTLKTGGVLYYQIPRTPEKMVLDDDKKLMDVIGRTRFPEYFRTHMRKSLLVRFKDFETDKPLVGVQVQLLHADSQTRYFLNTDEWGYIYKTDLKPGNYSVLITSSGYARIFQYGWEIGENGCAFYDERLKTNPLAVERQYFYRYFSLDYANANISGSIAAFAVGRKSWAPSFGSRDDAEESEFRGFRSETNKVMPPTPGRSEIWQLPDSTLPEANADLPELRSRFKDYAYWQPILYTNANGEVRFPVHFPDDITRWENYAAAMNENFQTGLGLSYTRAYKKVAASIAVPRFAIEGDEINAIGKALNYTGKEVAASFHFGTTTIRHRADTVFTSAFTLKIPLKIPAWHADSTNKLIADFRLQLINGYRDGEQREIPVFPKGMEKATGFFRVLERDTMMTLEVPENGELVIHAENSSADFLLQSLQKMESYPYACNEQIASQLKALLARKKISTLMNLEFEHDKTIRKRIQQLEKAQNPDGSWGWWSKGHIDYYMTCYITGVLKKAEAMGYKTDAATSSLVLIKRFLPHVEINQAIMALELLATFNEPWNYKDMVESLERKELNGSQRIALQHIRSMTGLKTDRTWLISMRTESYLGNIGYNGELNSAWRSSLLNTLKVYEINKRTGYQSENKYIIRFFLEQKNGTYGWNNTIETASILEGILEDVLKEKTQGQAARLKITHPNGDEVVQFPYTFKQSNKGPLYVRYTGTEPVYFTAYTRNWISEPLAESRHFKVESQLVQDGSTSQNLKTGKTAELQVTVTATKNGEYLMLRVPIPSGCSYGPKMGGGMGEIHREYAKNEVQIFIENITPGTFTYSIPLEVRYTGNQTLNPAQIELMYFPTFQGNTIIKKIHID